MKPIIPFLMVSALGAGVGWSLLAQEPATPRVTGKVLILQNERAFEGNIEKVGDSYRVRRGTGEIVVAASQALHLCADWDDALRFMRSRANLDDPDERLRLAKWCLGNHQVERAMAEAKIAMTMRPRHRETRSLVKVLEATPTGQRPRPASEPVVAPVPHIDLSFESVTAFNLRIHPILMNTCVSCHAGGYNGKFKLYRLYEGGERAARQRNLAAVLSFVSLAKPAASPLLVMAVCAMATRKRRPLPAGNRTRSSPCAPGSTRRSPTTRTCANARRRRLRRCHGRRQRLRPYPRSRSCLAWQPPSTPPTSDGAPVPPPIVPPAKTPAAAAPLPPDEFDAAHFNGVYHPNRK